MRTKAMSMAESDVVVVLHSLSIEDVPEVYDEIVPAGLPDAKQNPHLHKMENKGGAFFVDGPRGTRKTFLYRALLAKTRSEGHIALAIATSGIAASIRPGGRTAHSRFKIPLDLVEGSICRVSKQISLASLIKDCKLIIGDEALMAKRADVEALKDLLQDLTDSTELFGGKVIVLAGDSRVRQTLPIVHKLHLKESIRAFLHPAFAEFLFKIGNAIQSPDNYDLVDIPASMLMILI
ncbi:ATP-dependent DNA helicase RRM3-like protein [Tanacetum coccineum]